MANLAALRAAVFSLSAKNLRGGRITAPPAVRGLSEFGLFPKNSGPNPRVFSCCFFWGVPTLA